MNDLIIAYDFGTGGIKASLHNEEGIKLAAAFVPYETLYPGTGMHEQRPSDWWKSFIDSTRDLLEKSEADPLRIVALSISGHSLGVVPISKSGELLLESVPIWSDMRAEKQAGDYFKKADYDSWYLETGNGFPAHLYSAFKIQWYKENMPEVFGKTDVFLGTKDYINYLLTGKRYTDYSYASGSGVYDLKGWGYDEDLIDSLGLSRSVFPEIIPSTALVGTLTEEASEATGLPPHVKVICGGVDNSCMALGARGIKDGRVYTSLGSSSWIAVTSHEPIVDTDLKPFVFAHVVPGMFASATSIFSGGSSLQWIRNQFCIDLMNDRNQDAYAAMNTLAAASPVGSNKLIFNPSLAGGSGSDDTPNVRGAFLGLELVHTRSDVIRSVMEGIALSLRIALDRLREMTAVSDEMLLVGGGGKSPFWRQMFADIYDMKILETTVGQDAGSLGAAALAAVGTGMWSDFDRIDALHELVKVNSPDSKNAQKYAKLLGLYKRINGHLYDIGDMMADFDI